MSFIRVLQKKLKRTKTKQKLTTSWLFYGDKSEQSIQELCCLRLIFSKAPIISQNLQGRFVRKVDNAIHCINLYQVESGFIKPGQKYKEFTSRPVFTYALAIWPVTGQGVENTYTRWFLDQDNFE